MKTLKSILTASAFIFAIGGAFASKSYAPAVTYWYKTSTTSTTCTQIAINRCSNGSQNCTFTVSGVGSVLGYSGTDAVGCQTLLKMP